MSAPLVFLVCDRCEAHLEPQFESGFHFRDDRELAIAARARNLLLRTDKRN